MKRDAKTWLVLTVIAALAILGAAAAALIARLPPRVAGVPAELVPASWSEFRESPGHKQHVEAKGTACRECHDYERDGFKNPGVAPCVRCHDKEGAKTHVGGEPKKTDCLTCHAFAPNQEAATCKSCHANAQGHVSAIKEHVTTKCSECHRTHATPSIQPKTCTSCHDVDAQKHAAHSESKDCLDCHKGHEPAFQAKAKCGGCHEKTAGFAAPGFFGSATSFKPAGHDSCLTCHKSHEFAASAATCVGCHGNKPTLAASEAPRHDICTSCHLPHAPGAAAGSCVGCHANVKVEHHAGNDACIGCHAPHAGDAKVAACTSCHKTMTASSQPHAKGLACASCHKDHDFAPASKPALCAGCHAKEMALASTSSGHKDCASCHGTTTHQPSAAPACGTCHKNELATAPRGHQACTGCHEPHSGARLPQAATCASCHGDEQRSRHGHGVSGGCESCHRPHGPNGVASPPTCTSCHQRAQLPALHSSPSHATCTQCHSSHGPTKNDRASCTTNCHLDRRDHQPQAQVCSGCHVFRK